MVNISSNELNARINLVLVGLVNLGQKEEADGTQNDQSEAIKHGSHVGEHPQEGAEFEEVEGVLDKEQAKKLGHKSIQTWDSGISEFVLDLASRQDRVSFKELLEWLHIALLDNGLHALE